MKFDNEDCNRFVKDMTKAGYEVSHYHGRYFWEGPSVRCDRDGYDDVVRATKVKLQRDNLGLGWVVYPRRSGRLVKPQE